MSRCTCVVIAFHKKFRWGGGLHYCKMAPGNVNYWGRGIANYWGER